MKIFVFCSLIFTLILHNSHGQIVRPSFTAPDTVCMNETINITNTTTAASNYYWSFCSADLETEPEITNLGSFGGLLNQPVFMDYVFTNNKYYAFITNYSGGNLIRLDFGNSLLNTPTATNLGNFGGLLPGGVGSEGIQVVQNEGKWYAIIVSGYTPSGSNPKVIKIAFGANIENNTPIATDWGNLGNLYQPIDLILFQEGGVWYGLTVNAENNTVTRFNFTNSFENIPTGTNLGNIGGLEYPTGLFAINDNGTWRVFITNAGDRTRTGGQFSITRLDFGSSLLNAPTGTNLGNLGNTLGHPRDLTIIKSCDQIMGFIVNGSPGYNNIVRVNFNNDLGSIPTSTTLSNGGADFPHSVSKLFRVNEDVYGFITDAANNTVSLMRFKGCTNASIPSTSAQTPPPLSYDEPGIYNINLTVDIGLPTQSSFCKKVVVQYCGDMIVNSDTAICSNSEVQLLASGAKSYRWSPATGLDNPQSSSPLARPQQTTKYYLEATMPDNSIRLDSITITVLPAPNATISNDTTICPGSTASLRASGGDQYQWTPVDQLSATATSTTIASPVLTTKYFVRVSSLNGCFDEDSVTVSVRNYPAFTAGGDLSLCEGEGAVLTASGGNRYTWAPAELVSDPFASTTSATPPENTLFSVRIEENVCLFDTIIFLPVEIHQNPVVVAMSSNDINCTTPSTQLRAEGAASYLWSPSYGLDNTSIPNPVSYSDSTITYQVVGTNEFGCSSSAKVNVKSERSGIPGFVLPNAFTPNNDGKNDCFGLQRWGNIEIAQFTIYNRWGQIVFQTKNPRDCWDGTFNGRPQPIGGYTYIAIANTFCGQMKRTGMFTLIR